MASHRQHLGPRRRPRLLSRRFVRRVGNARRGPPRRWHRGSATRPGARRGNRRGHRLRRRGAVDGRHAPVPHPPLRRAARGGDPSDRRRSRERAREGAASGAAPSDAHALIDPAHARWRREGAWPRDRCGARRRGAGLRRAGLPDRCRRSGQAHLCGPHRPLARRPGRGEPRTPGRARACADDARRCRRAVRDRGRDPQRPRPDLPDDPQRGPRARIPRRPRPPDRPVAIGAAHERRRHRDPATGPALRHHPDGRDTWDGAEIRTCPRGDEWRSLCSAGRPPSSSGPGRGRRGRGERIGRGRRRERSGQCRCRGGRRSRCWCGCHRSWIRYG